MIRDNITILVAVGKNGEIGKDNKLLWHLPTDLKEFKKRTLGNIVVMGRKTFESIGKPLADRTNVIMTTNKEFSTNSEQSCMIAYCIEDILKMADVLNQEIFVIGGSEIYKQMLPYASTIYMTRVLGEFEADSFFENPSEKEWSLVSGEKVKTKKPEPYEYYFDEYHRNK